MERVTGICALGRWIGLACPELVPKLLPEACLAFTATSPLSLVQFPTSPIPF